MKSRRPRGRREKGEGRGRNEGEFFTTPPIDSGKESSSSTTTEMTRAGEGTMREMEGGRGNARQAGAETEGRMPERPRSGSWDWEVRRRQRARPTTNSAQAARSSSRSSNCSSNNQRWGQGRQKEEIDGLKGMRERGREGRKEATMDDFFFLSAESNNATYGGREVGSSRSSGCLNTSSPLRSSHLVDGGRAHQTRVALTLN